MTVFDAPADQVAGEVFNVGHSDENYTKRMIVDVVQEAIGGTAGSGSRRAVGTRATTGSTSRRSASSSATSPTTASR